MIYYLIIGPWFIIIEQEYYIICVLHTIRDFRWHFIHFDYFFYDILYYKFLHTGTYLDGITSNCTQTEWRMNRLYFASQRSLPLWPHGRPVLLMEFILHKNLLGLKDELISNGGKTTWSTSQNTVWARTQDLISLKIKLNEAVVEFSLLFVVVISRRQKRVQLMRIREKDAKKRQQAGGQEGTYRRKPTPVKRYAGDLLAPVSVTQHAVCCRCWLLGFYGISYSSETNRCNKILVKLPPFLCTWLISPCLVLLRATYKVCGTDRWTQVLPLAAWALPTTPRSTWTMTPAPPRPLQLQPRSSGSEQRGRPTALWFSNFVFLTHNLTNKPSAKVLSCPYIDWGNENAAFWGEMRIEDHLFGESYNITTTTTVFLRETLQNRY